MYNEKHIVIKSIPRYAINLISDKTLKIRKAISNHKEEVIITAILGTAAIVTAVSVASLSEQVNS